MLSSSFFTLEAISNTGIWQYPYSINLVNGVERSAGEFNLSNTGYDNSNSWGGGDEGTVTVTEWFKYPNFREKKSYVYKVRQREGIWQIYDYTVTNLGTE